MKKKWVMMLAVIMVFAFTAGVVAGPAVQEITANLATDIQFKVNGNAWTPKADDGSTLSPIIYKDRTYLPVRAIGEALGVKVDWDNASRTVILGAAAVQKPEPKPEVKPEPKPEVKPEPKPEVKPEPKPEVKPAAELAISPDKTDYNKNKEADVPVKITWGSASKIADITGTAMGGALKIQLKEGTHYTVKDNGDGTALLTIKTELTKLLPIPITAVPDATELTLTIKFDQGQKTFIIKVVS